MSCSVTWRPEGRGKSLDTGNSTASTLLEILRDFRDSPAALTFRFDHHDHVSLSAMAAANPGLRPCFKEMAALVSHVGVIVVEFAF